MRRFFGTPVVDYLPAFVLFIIAVIYLVTGYGYTPQVRAFPVSVGWAAIVLVLLDITARTHTAAGETLTRWFNPAALPKNEEARPQYARAKEISAVLWAAGFAALIVLGGFLVAVPVYVFASMRLRGKRPLWFCLVIGAAATLFIWALFTQLLQIELYPGMLFPEV